MDLSILDILYIVLIFFTVIIWSFLSIILYRLLKITSALMEVYEVYIDVKNIINLYNQIPKVIISYIKNIFTKK